MVQQKLLEYINNRLLGSIRCQPHASANENIVRKKLMKRLWDWSVADDLVRFHTCAFTPLVSHTNMKSFQTLASFQPGIDCVIESESDERGEHAE